MRLVAGLSRWGASALPQTPSRNRGKSPTSKREGRRGIGKGRGRDREMEWEAERDREGRELPPLYSTSGYGPDR